MGVVISLPAPGAHGSLLDQDRPALVTFGPRRTTASRTWAGTIPTSCRRSRVRGWACHPGREGTCVIYACHRWPAAIGPSAGHAGAARKAWNRGLEQCRKRYEAEKQWYWAIDLHRLWNQAKRQDPKLAWWKENSKCVYQEAFRNLDRVLCDFIASKKGERKGPRLGFPRRKKKGRCRDSFRFSTGVMRCSGTTVTLPRLGTIRTHESTEALARKLAEGRARILSATVSRSSAGSCPSRWRSTVISPIDIPDRGRRSGSMSVSNPW
jgi:hypothetical protein